MTRKQRKAEYNQMKHYDIWDDAENFDFKKVEAEYITVCNPKNARSRI
jgi:hypothetical protein